ncbi:MAG: RND transporter, partial [Giesbergeria sp.]
MNRYFPALPCAAIVLAAVLVGCAAPPRQTLPAAPVPAAWKEGAAAQAGFWHLAQPGEGVQADWWTRYGDRVLNALQHQAQRGNPGLAQSAARLRSAQAAVAGTR